MSVVTDLTWAQLNTALKSLIGTNLDFIVVDGEDNVPALINVRLITQSPASTEGIQAKDVIKFITRLHDACRLAQETANQGKTTGEKLTAFGAATAAAPRGTLVPITRTMVTQADLSTATRIVGTNA